MLALIKPIIPWVLYAMVFGTAIYGVLKDARWSFYLLVVLIPLPALWYPLHPLPFGKDTTDILVGASIVGAMINRGGFDSPKGGIVMWLFAAVSFGALVNVLVGFGLDLESGFSFVANWKNYFVMILLYFIAYSLFRKEDEQKIVMTLIGVVVLLIAIRAFRGFSEGSAFSYDKRSSGPFELLGLGANHFAAFLVHFAGLLFGLALFDKNKWRRRLFLGATLFSLHPLFFAYSRGAYAAALAVMLIYGLLRYRLLLVLLAALYFTWQVALPPTVVERIEMTSNEDGELEASAALRVVLWERANQHFRDNPLFGIGFNGFEYSMRGNVLRNAHNLFVQTAAEEGVIGLTALALLLLRAYWVAWWLYWRGRSDFQRGLGLGFLGCVSALIVTNLFGDRFSQFAVGGYFFIAFGVVERAWAACRDESYARPAGSSAPPMNAHANSLAGRP